MNPLLTRGVNRISRFGWINLLGWWRTENRHQPPETRSHVVSLRIKQGTNLESGVKTDQRCCLLFFNKPADLTFGRLKWSFPGFGSAAVCQSGLCDVWTRSGSMNPGKRPEPHWTHISVDIQETLTSTSDGSEGRTFRTGSDPGYCKTSELNWWINCRRIIYYK